MPCSSSLSSLPTIVPNGSAAVAIVSPRDAASGLPTGKRSLETRGIIAILIGL